MKKLNFFNKILFIINNIVAIMLLLSFFIAYIKPSSFSLAPVIGLFIPVLILINALFVVFWIIIGFRRQFLLSTLVLIVGYFYSAPVYKFSSSSEENIENSLKLMSYNVRKFNQEDWIDEIDISQKISTFIKQENPDVLALQEFVYSENVTIDYPYFYSPKIGSTNSSGLALYSKYQIIDQGRIFSEKHEDRIIYIDIVKKDDTLRLYNFHFQSLGLMPKEEYLGHRDSDRLLSRLKKAFKLQEEQLSPFTEVRNKHNGKVIALGDMNNTQYSWVYKKLKGNLKDSFIENGSGFGKTYEFKGFPLRIDYILVDKKLKVKNHKNFQVKLSDHYPIMATVSF